MGSVNESLPRLTGCGVNDSSEVTRLHSDSCSLAAQKDALGINRHNPIPLAFFQFLDSGYRDYTGVLDRDIDLFKFFDRPIVQTFDLRLLCYIADQRNGVYTGRFKFLCYLMDGILVGSQNKMSTFVGKPFGNTFADASTSAGDQNTLLFESFHGDNCIMWKDTNSFLDAIASACSSHQLI